MRNALALVLKSVDESAEADQLERFRRLYDETEPLVRAVIFQIQGASQIDDLVQDAFVKIWKGLPAFREQSSVKSWIYKVATNVALDASRSTKRRGENHHGDLSQVADPASSVEKKLEARDLVGKALHSLSEEHRTVAVLALIHERSLDEIADILGLSLGTVKSRLHYAKENLRAYLEGAGL